MNVRVYRDTAAIGAAAATLFAAQVISKPDSVLGLALPIRKWRSCTVTARWIIPG